MNTRTLVVAALLLTTLVATAQTAEARPRIRAGTFDVDWSNLLLFRQNSAPILDTAGNEVGTSSTSEFSFLTGVAPKYFVVDNVAVGDEVELWGQNVPIQEVAANADTIDYELMTRVSQRVPRIVKYL